MAMPLTIVGTAFNAAWEGIQDGEHKNLVETHRGNDSKVRCRDVRAPSTRLPNSLLAPRNNSRFWKSGIRSLSSAVFWKRR